MFNVQYTELGNIMYNGGQIPKKNQIIHVYTKARDSVL